MDTSHDTEIQEIKKFYDRFLGWDVLSAGDVAQILGISRRKVMLYVEQGIISPTVQAEGPGRHRKFSVGDLALFMLCYHLDKIGLAPRRLQEIGPQVASFFKVPFGEGVRPTSITFFWDGEGDVIRIVEAQVGDVPTEIALDYYAIIQVNLRKLEIDSVESYNRFAVKKRG